MKKKTVSNDSLKEKIEEILTPYPDPMSRNDFRIVCHIGTRTSLYLLQSGLVPCKNNGKKTRCYIQDIPRSKNLIRQAAQRILSRYTVLIGAEDDADGRIVFRVVDLRSIIIQIHIDLPGGFGREFGGFQLDQHIYLYYCYQLGILPKKQQPRINRPELERIWKDTEKILAEHAFVHDHRFPSLQAIVDYRKSLSRQIDALAAQRAEIVKQMRRKDAPPELADQRMALTCKIAELRKENKIAEGAIKRIQRTRESNRIDRENRMPLHPRPRRRRREQERE